MFSFTTSETIIPTLKFTKAELLYVATHMMQEVDIKDQESVIDMVEARYYLNRIRSEVSQAIYKGVLEGGVEVHKGNKKTPQKPHLPSVSELSKQFPYLTEKEILEIISAAETQDTPQNGVEIETPLPQIVKEDIYEEEPQTGAAYEKKQRDKENSTKFATLLGI